MHVIRLFMLWGALYSTSCLGQACPKTVYSFDSSFRAQFIEGQYLGEIRDMQQGKKMFLDLVKLSFPHFKYVFDLYEREVYIQTYLGERLWLPIQEQVLKTFKRYVKAKDHLILFCRNLGDLNHEPIVVIIDYERVFTPEVY